MSSRRKTAELAHELFSLSVENGHVSPERVTGVLAWVEKHRPASSSAVLRAYKRLVEAEIARSRAVIEYAGAVSPAVVQQIGAAMTRRYGRTVDPVAVSNPGLIAGLRVRVGCDIFENTVVSQLAALRPVS